MSAPRPHPSAPSSEDAELAESERARAPPIEQLPDAVLSQVLERVGLHGAALARAVCRRWRDAAEAVSWARLEVDVRSGSAEHADVLALLLVGAPAPACGGAPSLRRWIRVAPGASLRLRVAAVSTCGLHAATLWSSGVALLAACAAAASGGGLGEVEVEFRRRASPRACLADLLAALAPLGAVGPDGAGRGALRRLALRSEGLRKDFGYDAFPPAPELERLLRPLAALERLVLPVCSAADRPAAAALARSLPRLRELEVNLEGYGAAGGLAALPSLECLAVEDGATGALRDPPDAVPLLEGLAAGPAALSLKELRVPALLSRAALRALPRLAALERLRGPFSVCADVGGDDLAGLGSLPALRSLGLLRLCPAGPEAAAQQLAGLAAALARSAALTDLDLRIGPPPPAAALEELAALAGAARGRLSLEMEVDLAPGRPAEVAAALAAAPPRRLALAVAVGAEALRGGWLDGLAAFSACSAGDIEGALEALAQSPAMLCGAAARALPAARFLFADAWQAGRPPAQSLTR
eukprot:tig00000147_g9510.t1